MADGDAPHRRDEGGIAMITVRHAICDHRGEECRGLKGVDLAIRSDGVRGHDGISPQTARAIKKAIAGVKVADTQQTVTASGLHRRHAMVCHVGMKAVTSSAIDHAQLIAIHYEGAADTMLTNEGGKTVVTSTDVGTLETCGDRSRSGDDVRVWRRCGGDEYVRRKESSHGEYTQTTQYGRRASRRQALTQVECYCASNSSYIN